jgi:Na+/proline symporter
MYSVLKSRNPQDALYNIIIFLVYLIIVTFILRFLWNGTLVKYISIFKPVDSLFHTFMLAFALTVFKL